MRLLQDVAVAMRLAKESNRITKRDMMHKLQSMFSARWYVMTVFTLHLAYPCSLWLIICTSRYLYICRRAAAMQDSIPRPVVP